MEAPGGRGGAQTYRGGRLVVAQRRQRVRQRRAVAQRGAVHPLQRGGSRLGQRRVDDALLAALRVRINRGALAAVKRAVSWKDNIFCY